MTPDKMTGNGEVSGDISNVVETDESHKDDSRRPLLEIPEDDKTLHLVTREQSISFTFSGPMPHPLILKQYEAILPGAAERILSMAERQQQNRIHLETVVVEGGAKRSNFGLVCSTLVLLATLSASVYMVKLGQAIAGVTSFVLALATLMGAFIYSTNNRRAERKERTALLSKMTEPKDA
ncbi:MAG: DUF2335 domain-containing protein [Armatimonadetes bacterium]|nr:DUF2335 domain-containing protein [Armatimonadota bacterium]